MILSENTSAATHHAWRGHMANDIGATYGYEPLATLTVGDNELVLSGTLGVYRVPRDAVTKLGKGKFYPWFFSAVRIHHRVKNLPGDLQFKPLDTTPREVLRQLKSLGYPTA